MVSYFSSFTQGQIQNENEQPDIYLAMALSKHGCCYIRSFACFITANAIGIPTRLIKNECHAFVEMHMPQKGWMQVDLGGCGAGYVNPDGNDEFNNYTNPDVDPWNGSGNGNGNGNGNESTVKIETEK